MLAYSVTLTRQMTKNLRYPVYVSDKEDGIRCLLGCRDGKLQPFSRKLKVIPNLYIREWAENEGIAGLDGELVIPGKTFHEIQSYVMSEITMIQQPFEFRVFDHYWINWDKGFQSRLQLLQNKINMYAPKNVVVLPQTEIGNEDELWVWFRQTIEAGKEGLIVRSLHGPYKQGRSTMREQFMLKMKHYEEGEAIIIGFEPEYENQNEQTKDETGAAKRSSHQANRHARERLGSLVCKDCKTEEIFCIGSGFDHSQKAEIWNARPQYLGTTVTYKWQVHGTLNKPRTPIFKGIRLD